MLDEKQLKDEKLLCSFEERQLVLIKDSLARIYSTLELWNVKGHIDHVFNYNEDEKRMISSFRFILRLLIKFL